MLVWEGFSEIWWVEIKVDGSTCPWDQTVQWPGHHRRHYFVEAADGRGELHHLTRASSSWRPVAGARASRVQLAKPRAGNEWRELGGSSPACVRVCTLVRYELSLIAGTLDLEQSASKVAAWGSNDLAVRPPAMPWNMVHISAIRIRPRSEQWRRQRYCCSIVSLCSQELNVGHGYVCVWSRQGLRWNALADANGQLVAYIMFGAIAYTLPLRIKLSLKTLNLPWPT